MIFDRTLEDVRRAEEIVNNSVKKEIPLTDDEKTILERGRVTINTINRIEYNQMELKSILEYMGYYNVQIQNKTNWAREDVFTDIDLERLVKNNEILRNAFFALRDSPPNPITKYYYEEFNALEKILYDITRNANETREMYRECGTFECGE